MNYVITNGTVFIDGHGNTVKQNEARVFDNKTKAQNFLKSSVSKCLKNLGFKVVETEMEESTNENIKTNSQYIEVNVDDLKNSINDLSSKLSTLNGNKDWLLEMQSNVDKEISDIMHYIEFNNFSACDGYKLCKALKELRLKRRKIKNELELINILNTQSLKQLALGKTNLAISGLDNKQYEPRILQELFQNKDVDVAVSHSAQIDV